MPCGVPWPASAAISTARAMVPPDGRPCGVGGCMSKRFWKASISRLPSLLRDLCIIVRPIDRVEAAQSITYDHNPLWKLGHALVIAPAVRSEPIDGDRGQRLRILDQFIEGHAGQAA